MHLGIFNIQELKNKYEIIIKDLYYQKLRLDIIAFMETKKGIGND